MSAAIWSVLALGAVLFLAAITRGAFRNDPGDD